MHVKLENVKPMEARLNYQLEAEAAVKFSYPGLVEKKKSDKRKYFGDKLQPKKTWKKHKVSWCQLGVGHSTHITSPTDHT